MNILQKIFTDHFEEMIYLQHPRDSVIENVEKMINCGNPAFGGAMYTCPCCGIFKFVPFRCHSRFCPTCGNMYSIDRTTSGFIRISKSVIMNMDHVKTYKPMVNGLMAAAFTDSSVVYISRKYLKDVRSQIMEVRNERKSKERTSIQL